MSRSDAIALLSDENRYRIYFYEPGRLCQELGALSNGEATYWADPGATIVIPEVNLQMMTSAAAALASQGFFDSFKPLPPQTT